MCIIHQSANVVLNIQRATIRSVRESSPPVQGVPKLLDFLPLQHAECLAREILAIDLFRIENVTKFIAAQTVEAGVVGIQFGAADFVPADVKEMCRSQIAC
jgi:hypothetical protein